MDDVTIITLYYCNQIPFVAGQLQRRTVPTISACFKLLQLLSGGTIDDDVLQLAVCFGKF